MQGACARTIFGQIKAFNANRREPRRFLDLQNSILRSILVYDATRMRRRGFLRILYFLSRFGGYLGGFPSRWARFRGLLKYTTARPCAGEDLYAFQSFSRQLEATQGVFRVAEPVSEIYFSRRLHAHAQDGIFTHFIFFIAIRSVSRGFSSRWTRFRGLLKYMTARATNHFTQRAISC